MNFTFAGVATETTTINDVTCNYGNLVSMTTKIYLHSFAVDGIRPYIWNICPLRQHQYLVVLAVMEMMLPWQLRNTFIIEALKGVRT